MQLHSFPMDTQSCPLIFGSFGYTKDELIYYWDSVHAIGFEPGMTLSQFDLIKSMYRNTSVNFRQGEFSILQANFNLQRHTGYFLIQLYVPCILIVVLSWVSFWINREATSDRVGLGITTVLTLSTFGLDSRTDLPKVHYATALDWFMIMCFSFVIATLLEFAGVHYFTKVGSGEINESSEDGDWDDIEIDDFEGESSCEHNSLTEAGQSEDFSPNRSSSVLIQTAKSAFTQTEEKVQCWRQFFFCLIASAAYQRSKRPNLTAGERVNSVSRIDRVSRVIFPVIFIILNVSYWNFYNRPGKDDAWMENAEHV